MKTILITGINGFLGSHLAKQLSSEYEIIGLEYNVENLYRIKENSFRVYSSNDVDFKQIINKNKVYAIIHAATIYKKEDESLNDLLSTNLLLPVNLFEISQVSNVKMFFNIDSFFNYKNTKYSYLTEYTLSKKHVLDWLKIINGPCKLINMKLHHIYGPNDAPNKFVPQIISALKTNQKFLNLTLGNQIRDFIYVDDVVNAFRIFLRNHNDFIKDFIEIEVGTGKTYSIRRFVTKAKEIIKSDTELRFGAIPYRKNEIMKVKTNNSILLSLGWKPEFNLKEGLTKTINS